MKHILISQPMHGRSEESILTTMKGVESWAQFVFPDNDIEIIDNYHHRAEPDYINNKRIWHLGQSISLMASADLVIFMDGYEKANGCMVEMAVVEKYGIEHIFESDLRNMVKERLNKLGEAVCEE